MLALESVNACYGKAHILFDLSLRIGTGEIVALLGRNGAGKSTALKSIIGLVPVTSGKIEFRGECIEGREPWEIARRGLGYVAEDRRIFSALTVRENLETGRQAARAELSAWTPEKLFEIFPNLALVQDRPAGRISGGEQQMLAVARTLMGNPLCILLDEPSEGLAPMIVERMAVAVRELRSHGVSVLLSEQNLRFAAAIADRTYIIEAGRVRYSGSMAGLMASEEVRREYLAP